MCRVAWIVWLTVGLHKRGWGDSKHSRIVSSDRDVQVPRFVVRLGMRQRMSAGAAHAPEAVLRLRSASEACQQHAPNLMAWSQHAIEELQMDSGSWFSGLAAVGAPANGPHLMI